MQYIRSIQTVDLSLLKSNPPQLLVSAIGTVSSGGWKNGTLDARHYFVPPADGIQDFDFAATPPVGPSIQIILPISAQTVVFPIPSWLKGVRVHSATNNIEADLGVSKNIEIQ